jgi:hypothetical protein
LGGTSKTGGLPAGSVTTNEVLKAQEYVKDFLKDSKHLLSFYLSQKT